MDSRWDDSAGNDNGSEASLVSRDQNLEEPIEPEEDPEEVLRLKLKALSMRMGCFIVPYPIPGCNKYNMYYNVKGLNIQAGAKAGARPCGSTWKSADKFIVCLGCYTKYHIAHNSEPEKVEELLNLIP